jgi:hypothetical protein
VAVAAAAAGLLAPHVAVAGTPGGGFVRPALPPGDGSLIGALQVDAGTTWAFGMTFTPYGRGSAVTPLLLTGDGTGRWSQAPLAPFGGHGRINAAAAHGAGDGWVVGDEDDSLGGIYTQHWNGSAWSLVTAPLPDGARGGGLLSVSEPAPHDVWGAGWSEITDSVIPDPNGGPTRIVSHFEALVEHWNGSAWQRIPVPQAADFTPQTVVARGPGDVWVAGYSAEDNPEIQHFDGRRWTPQALPATGVFGEVAQLGQSPDGTLWAVGRTGLDDSDRGHALVLRRTAGTWRQVAAPPALHRFTGLAVTPGGITAVGDTIADGSPALYRLTGPAWRQVPLPQPSDGSYWYVLGLAAGPAGLTLAGGTQTSETTESVPLVLTGSGG